MTEILSCDSLNFIKKKTDEILKYKNNEWENIEFKLKLKIINSLLKVQDQKIIIINLKQRKPLKLMMIIYSIERKNNKYKQFNNKILNFTKNFREKYDKKNNLCFSGLNTSYLNEIIEEYNSLIYKMIIENKIDINNLFNLFNNPEEYNIFLNNKMKITQILNYKNTIIIKYSSNNEVILELYLTSNKITNNLPFKYKIKLKIVD